MEARGHSQIVAVHFCGSYPIGHGPAPPYHLSIGHGPAPPYQSIHPLSSLDRALRLMIKVNASSLTQCMHAGLEDAMSELTHVNVNN
jgi:hypothetical protein